MWQDVTRVSLLGYLTHGADFVAGCDASFTARSSLYVHLTKHDKDGGKMVFHCPVEGCSRKYSTKALLRTHILKHIMSGKSISDISGQEMAQLLIGGGADKDEPGRPSADEEGETKALVETALNCLWWVDRHRGICSALPTSLFLITSTIYFDLCVK